MMRSIALCILLLLLLCGTASARDITQSQTYNLMVFMTDSADHLTGKTGLTPITVNASKSGAAFATITPTITERGYGWYNLALTAAHTDTLGDLVFHITATGADPSDFVLRVITANVTCGSVLDKTGYSIVNVFPNNFSNMQITSGGYVTAGTNLDKTGYTVNSNLDKTGYTCAAVQDKTGYTLSQAFPANFASLAISGSGYITAGTNIDKTGYACATVQDKSGYSLSQAFPTNFASLAITSSGYVTAGSVGDKTGYTCATVQDKTGYSLSASGIDGIWDEVVEGSLTARGMLRINQAFVAGKRTGGGTASISFYGADGLTTRIYMSGVDENGNTSEIVVNGN